MKKTQVLISVAVVTIQSLTVLSQHVGIGTTTPAFKLDVKTGSINTDSVYRIGGNTVLAIKGTNNTFVGRSSGSLTVAGTNNASLGFEALANNTDGGFNVAIGSSSLFSNTTGSHNTALGVRALAANTIGSINAAIGEDALSSNTSGSYNTATGMLTLTENSTGWLNTANGYRSLMNNTTGDYNTAVGAEAMTNTTAADYNTVIGHRAGYEHNMGFNNTLLGAGAEVWFAGQFNSIAIGNISVCPDNSTVRIGNSANWSYGGYANWTNISDARFKKNVREDVPGIAFIMRLRPVNYQFDMKALGEKLNENKRRPSDKTMQQAYAEKEKMIWTGFLAQEVEEAARLSNFHFSGVDKPRNEDGVYGLRYAEFVVPLVKGMQEQQQLINELRTENEELKKRMARLEALVGKR